MIANEMDICWITERIVALCDPDQLYLFGSYAKGTEHDGSDLDFLIIVPSSLPRPHRGKDIRTALSNFPYHLDLLFFTPQELEEERKDLHSFVSAIMTNGRLLHQKGHMGIHRTQ